MQELQDLARKLLTDKTVDIVIGYEQGPRGIRPAFITNPVDTSRLVFDHGCVQNLATYLSPRRVHLAPYKKRAIVVKACDARAVAGMVREHQIERESFVLLGIRCGGVVRNPAVDKSLNEQTVADRCGECEVREPKFADHVLGAMPAAPPRTTRRADLIRKLDAMSASERFAFWQKELERCVRCHACREVCPMCSCERCVADKTQPQWIESSPHPRANLAWQFVRTLHQAGRCVDCGECERACPAGIPLGVIASKVAQIVEKRFGYRSTDDPSAPTPIGDYRLDDQQEFIL